MLSRSLYLLCEHIFHSCYVQSLQSSVLLVRYHDYFLPLDPSSWLLEHPEEFALLKAYGHVLMFPLYYIGSLLLHRRQKSGPSSNLELNPNSLCPIPSIMRPQLFCTSLVRTIVPVHIIHMQYRFL